MTPAVSLPPPARSRLLDGARTALAVLGTGLIFAASTVGAAVAHLDHPSARRFVVATLDQVLAPMFKGRIVVEKIDRVVLARGIVQGVDLFIEDADGHRVIVAKGVSARLSPVRLVKSLLGDGPLDLALSEVRIDFGDVLLRDDASGVPTIAGAFDAKEPPKPKKPGEKDKGLNLRIDRLSAEHLWAHGAVSGQIVDADLPRVLGSLQLDEKTLRGALSPVQITARALPIEAREGTVLLDATVAAPMTDEGKLVLAANAHAKVGKLLAHVRGSLSGDDVDAHVEVPTFEPDALEAIVRGVKLGAPASAVVDASGTLKDLKATAKVKLGEGSVDLQAGLVRAAKMEATVTGHLEAISLPDAAPSAPAGKITGDVQAKAIIDGSHIDATYEVTTRATTVAAQPVPAITTTGTFDGTRLAGTLDAAEPGAPTHVVYALAPEPGNPNVRGLDVEVHTNAPLLSRVGRLGNVVAGAARVDAKAHLTLGEKVLVRGDAKVRAHTLAVSGTTVGTAEIAAKFDGDVASPTVHAVVHARDVQTGGLDLASTVVRVDGPVLSPHVGIAVVSREGDSVNASLSLGLSNGVSARGLDATLGRNQEKVRVRVASVQAGHGVVKVDGVQIEGDAGNLTANAFYGPGTLRAKVFSRGLDLAVISRAVGESVPPMKGSVALDIDIDRRPGKTRGHAIVDAKGVHAAFIEGLDAKVAASIEDRALTASVNAELSGVGSVAVVTDGARLGGDLLDPKAFTEATGDVRTTAQIDLARAFALMPVFFRPVADLSGRLSTDVKVSRKAGEARPDVAAAASTRGLTVQTLPKDGLPGERLAGIDVAVKSTYAARANDLVLGLAAADQNGSLVEVGFRSLPPIDALIEGDPAVKEKLFDTPFRLSVVVPQRKLADLPAAVPTKGLRGSAGLDVAVVGTVRRPDVRVAVEVTGFEGARIRQRRSDPLDVKAVATFVNDRGHLVASLDNGGRMVLDANVDANLVLADVLEGRAGGPRWDAGGDVRFFALPLRPVSSVGTVPLSGCVSGSVSLRGLHQDAKAAVDLRVDGLRVKGVSFKEVRVTGKAENGMASVDAVVLQSDGELRVESEGGLSWGSAVVPTPDFGRPAEGRLTANAFQLAPFQPLLDAQLSKLDGRLSADLRYRQASADPKTGKLTGNLSLRGGVVDAVLIGQEFRDLTADVSIAEDGEIKLSNTSFRGVEGRATIDAVAHVEGPTLKDAVAKVKIAKRQKLPITFQGSELGEAWGEIEVNAKAQTGGVLKLEVAVPRLQLEMPDTPTKSTQSLDAEPTVRIGTTEIVATSDVPPRFTVLPLGNPKGEKIQAPPPPSQDPVITESTTVATPTVKAAPPADKGGVQVHVALGQIRLYKSGQLDLYVRGALDASTLGETVAVSGIINAERGWVEVQGRRFSVERATVSFDPDRPPSDPTIAATALYVAPDSTRVFADFIGTVANGRLKLRSEPALTQSEILSLVVFGQREGATAQSGQKTSGANRAASLGGGVVTQGLNKALSDISPVEITTRIDTTSGQNPRPEVGVAVTKDVSAAVSFRTGLPTPGQSPDRSLLKLDYRFRPRWAIETTLGDKGTSIVDLTWKYRY